MAPWSIYSVLLVFIALSIGMGSESVTKDRRNGLIQEAVRSLLGMKELPKPDKNGHVRKHQSPPKYMLDLYDRYKSGQVSSRGNTVRSILPMKGKLEGVDMLVFNLTGVHPTEKILQGKLHIFKRRRIKGVKKKDREIQGFRLKLIDLTRKSVPNLAEMDMGRNVHGWQSFDVTNAVKSCREAKHDGHYLLGVTLEAKRPNSKFKSMAMRRVLKLSTQPFLILFSEDNSTQPSTKEEGPKRQLFFNSTRGKISREFTRLRGKRSVLSNELPDYPLYEDLASKTKPELLLNKIKFRKVDPNVIPYPDDIKPIKPMKQINKHKTKRKHRKLPQSWHVPKAGQENDSMLDESRDPSLMCQRKKLMVDFADIGWSEWIISPKSFEAHYCTGRCPFPLNKFVRPSNHATIQSIVHAIGLSPEVPAPCCVPDIMTSVTLLYFDEDRNVVLKNYPGMTVESCACR